MRELMFATRVIGDQHPCCIVLEAGPTHYGLESALALVDAAAASGADAIKFQIGDAKRLIPDPDVMFTYTYLVDKHTGETAVCTESLQEILLRRQLTDSGIIRVGISIEIIISTVLYLHRKLVVLVRQFELPVFYNRSYRLDQRAIALLDLCRIYLRSCHMAVCHDFPVL